MSMKHLVTATILAASLPGAAARASSEDAWAEFNARVTRACIAASGIRRPLPSTIVPVDERSGRVAMLVSDRTPHSMEAKLCIYDKRARTAYVGSAEMWSAPPQKK